MTPDIRTITRRTFLSTTSAGLIIHEAVNQIDGQRQDSQMLMPSVLGQLSSSDKVFIREAILTAGDADDQFGTSVDVSTDGSTALISATYDEDPNGLLAGSAYIFQRENGEWNQQTKLTPDDGDEQDRFGNSVAISGDGTTAVLGTANDEDPNGTDSGSAYIFSEQNEEWTQQSKLVPDDGDSDDKFGSFVDISADGSVVLVTAKGDEDAGGQSVGSAYVFERDGETWKQQEKLTAEGDESTFEFGWSVGVSEDGSLAVIGAPIYDEAGAAFVYSQSGDTWNQQSILTADDGDSGDVFGLSVSISDDGTTIIASALADSNPNGDTAGSAYIFSYSGSSWNQQTKLMPVDGDSDDAFGHSTDISSDGTIALISARLDETEDSGEGSAYVFTANQEGWSQRTKFNEDAAEEGADSTFFGDSAALSSDGTVAMIGAPLYDLTGQTYVYQSSPTDGDDTPTPTPTDTPTPTPTDTPTPTPTDTSTPTPTDTPTPTPTDTPTPTPTDTPTPTPTISQTTSSTTTPSGPQTIGGILTAILVGIFSTEAMVVVGISIIVVMIVQTWPDDE